MSSQDWPVDHACRLARGRVGRRGQSQGATYTGGFQDFIVWALMPRPKLKSRGATYAGDATNAGGFTVYMYILYILPIIIQDLFSHIGIVMNNWCTPE